MNNKSLNNSINLQSLFYRTSVPNRKKRANSNVNYSFSEATSYIAERSAQVSPRVQKKLTSYKPTTSLAEENMVRNFNKFSKNLEKQDIPSNIPQRIELPLFFNTPNRIAPINGRKFSVQSKPTQPYSAESHIYVRSQRRLKDYTYLAFACKRAGKTRDEGRAYYSMGVLNDNIGKYKEAINFYQKFLQVCKNIGDQHGEALAYNCIGVDYLLLSKEHPEFLQRAIENNLKHEELGDINGKFLANINLGLCYDQLNDVKSSMKYYQNALRYSIKMANLVGQSIAIGNIGRIGTLGLHNNKERMRVFIEKYMKLSEGLNDRKGELNGLIKMGQINIQEGQFNQGKDQFVKALQYTESNVNQDILNMAKCGLAISQVEGNKVDYQDNYAQKTFYRTQNQKPFLDKLQNNL